MMHHQFYFVTILSQNHTKLSRVGSCTNQARSTIHNINIHSTHTHKVQEVYRQQAKHSSIVRSKSRMCNVIPLDRKSLSSLETSFACRNLLQISSKSSVIVCNEEHVYRFNETK